MAHTEQEHPIQRGKRVIIVKVKKGSEEPDYEEVFKKGRKLTGRLMSSIETGKIIAITNGHGETGYAICNPLINIFCKEDSIIAESNRSLHLVKLA